MIVSDERVARFVSDGLCFPLCPPYVAIGIERDGMIRAGVVLNVFEGHDVHVSAVGTGWTREFFRELGLYIFEQLGCLRATMITEWPNVVPYVERLGGRREGLLRNHFGPNRDGILMGVLKEEYQFRLTVKADSGINSAI